MTFNNFFILSSFLVSQTYCDSGAVITETDFVSHREGRDHSTGGGVVEGRDYSGGGVVSSGYGVPSDSYSAGSSSYAAPSTGYGAPSAGYGAPSAVGSSYATPSTGYGTPSAPVYVYQQGQGQQQTNSA